MTGATSVDAGENLAGDSVRTRRADYAKSFKYHGSIDPAIMYMPA